MQRTDFPVCGSLLRRFAANGTRQALAAAFFFATTLLLNSSLTAKGYTAYFVNWNVAGLVSAVVSFGLYNEVIRRLVLGHNLRQLLHALRLPLAAQLVGLALLSWLIGRFSNYDGVLIFFIAGSTAIGNVATAVALGRDHFQGFLQSEFAQSLGFLLLVAALLPHDPRLIGYLYVAALGIKIAVYGLSRKQAGELHRPASLLADATQPKPRDHLINAYANSLLQIATLRGFFIVTGWVISTSQLERIAVAWAFCDRAVMVVQGVNQVFYPKLMRGGISKRARRWVKTLTVTVFAAVALGMIFLWALFSLWKGVDISGVVWLSAGICLAFIPYVVRLLKMTEALAEYRFRSLFISHMVAVVTLVLVTTAAISAHLQTVWFPVALILVVSLAGLPPLYKTPYITPPRAA